MTLRAESAAPLPPAAVPADAVATAPPAPPSPPAPVKGKGSRRGALVVLALIAISLGWYFTSDRLTPYTSQARVQAFVVPVAAEVSGKVLKVHVANDDEVQSGATLLEIDPEPYRIALQRARSDYETVRRSVIGSTSGVAAAEAGLQAARAELAYARQDAQRQEQIRAEDPGAISLRRVQNARTNLLKAQSQELAAQADLRRAQEAAGASGDENAQLISARSAIEKAELDLARTRVTAPSHGVVTDLRTDVGQFAQAGAPAMTLIIRRDVWINADMTENNLGNVDVGDPAAIVLDALPGRVLSGHVRSVGNGVGAGQPAQPGALPQVDNSRDWLRQAQRFPVGITFDPAELDALSDLHDLRIGGQADVVVYTGDHAVMNWIAARYIGLMSYFSYLY